MSDNVLHLGISIPINYMIGSYPVMALYSGPSQIWSAKKPAPFVKAEGDWAMDVNVFTSNEINGDESTIEKVYFKNLGGKTITITYDFEASPYDANFYIFTLDSETEILTTQKDGTAYGECGRTGSADLTFPDDEEHFICLKYSKWVDCEPWGRDNVIVTFPRELLGDIKWIVVGEAIRCDYTSGNQFKYIYQDLQLSSDGVLINMHKDGELISKEPIASPSDISSWDVSNVTNMNSTFNGCGNLTSLNVSGWNTSKVMDMSKMFLNCSNLTSLDVSGWDTSKVMDMSRMFGGCYNLTSLDVSGWNTSNVADMSGMFLNCSNFTSLNVSSWDVSNVTNMNSTFNGCGNLTSLNVSSWNTSKVMDMSKMFNSCSKLTSLGVSSWNTSKVTDMSSVFFNCSELTSLDLSSWDVSNVTNMNSTFNSCSKLTSLGDISSWNTSKVMDMSKMFSSCSELTSLDLSSWDVSNVTNMDNMFSYCGKLTSLGDLSGWNTSKVTNMYDMFWGCYSLTSLDVSSWDVSNVTNMGGMFATVPMEDNQYSTLTSLNLSGWDVSNVTNMYNMFYFSSALTSLNLSGWDVSNVTNMSGMFGECRTLTTVIGPITGISVYIDLSVCPLTHDSAMVFLNGLNTVTETKTITFESTTYGTLTEAEIAAATAKGWTVKSAA